MTQKLVADNSIFEETALIWVFFPNMLRDRSLLGIRTYTIDKTHIYFLCNLFPNMNNCPVGNPL